VSKILRLAPAVTAEFTYALKIGVATAEFTRQNTEERRLKKMVSKAYKTCLLLIEKMVKHGYVNQINRESLAKLISMYIGADQRTIDKYVRVCVQWNLLTPHPANKDAYYIRLIEADKQMKEVFDRPMKQITLEQSSS